MQCFVTGTSGRIGGAIVTELLANGYTVVATDQVAPRTPVDAPADRYRFIQMELDDVEAIRAAMSGSDALIHMAAIPSPGHHPDEFVFNNNMTAAFNTMQAASLLDIRKAVVASSLSALGTVWAPVPFNPQYVPVDEDHPLLPYDCYSLSKGLIEHIAWMFHRRTGMEVAAMRFPWVVRPSEFPDAIERVRNDLAGYAPHVWTYVDVRDAARGCRLALEATGYGCEVFDIVAGDTLSDVPTMELLATYAPDTEIRRPIEGTKTAYSQERAKRVIGYEAIYSWRRPE